VLRLLQHVVHMKDLSPTRANGGICGLSASWHDVRVNQGKEEARNG
jgi:hypothetical protein